MKYLVFSDVHANIFALEALLKAVEKKVDGFICLGDTVGYGPFNDECLERISNLKNIVYLRGNHEEIFETQNTSYCSLLAKQFFDYSFKYFSKTELISRTLKFEASNWVFLHSFQSEKKWLYVYNPDNLASEIHTNYFLGHTHIQKVININSFSIVNCGSVGQNRIHKDFFDYAIWQSDTGVYQLYSEKYELEKFLAELKARNYPSELINYYQA